MTTASALMAQVQTELGDTSGIKFTSSMIYGWLDEAQKVWVMSLRNLKGIKSYSIVTNQDSVALPSNCVMIEAIAGSRGWLKKIAPITTTDFLNQQSAVQNAYGTDPSNYSEMDGRIYLYPRYSNSSLVSLLNATTAAADTTLTLASTGNLRSYGRVGIGSEDVEYTGKTSTTLTGCRRGVGGTTAASYASGQAVTMHDLTFYYRKSADTLASTASPEIRPVYHETLKLYAKYLAYKMEGSHDVAAREYELWTAALSQAAYTAKKENVGQTQIRDMDSQMISGFYGPI